MCPALSVSVSCLSQPVLHGFPQFWGRLSHHILLAVVGSAPGSQTHNWRESVESKSGLSRGAQQVMTGLHWHLLTCSAGLSQLDEVFPPLILFYPPVVFFFLTNCSGQREPLDSRSGMSLMSSQSLSCASWGWQGALLAGIPLCPVCAGREGGWIPPSVPLAPTSREEGV